MLLKLVGFSDTLPRANKNLSLPYRVTTWYNQSLVLEIHFNIIDLNTRGSLKIVTTLGHFSAILYSTLHWGTFILYTTLHPFAPSIFRRGEIALTDGENFIQYWTKNRIAGHLVLADGMVVLPHIFPQNERKY